MQVVMLEMQREPCASEYVVVALMEEHPKVGCGIGFLVITLHTSHGRIYSQNVAGDTGLSSKYKCGH
jgi:hypothetical protein